MSAMWILLRSEADVSRVQRELQGLGLWTRRLEAARGHAVGLEVERHSTRVSPERVAAIDGVVQVMRPESPHPRVDAQSGVTLRIGKLGLGGRAEPVLMAGPCSVESEAQIHAAASMAAAAGARVLRGGAFKPRSSPYSFSGEGRPALEWMRAAADAHGLAIVTEVMSEHDIDVVAEHAELLQVGSRNMQNFALLAAVGHTKKPVLLKRGMSARIEDWLLAGEHLLKAGAAGVIFCERGIQGIDTTTRNVLDLGAVALLKHVLGQPVIVDPSHAAGRRDLVPALARAALAAGADGLLVEAHPEPHAAKSDGAQALDARGLAELGAALGFTAPKRTESPVSSSSSNVQPW